MSRGADGRSSVTAFPLKSETVFPPFYAHYISAVCHKGKSANKRSFHPRGTWFRNCGWTQITSLFQFKILLAGLQVEQIVTGINSGLLLCVLPENIEINLSDHVAASWIPKHQIQARFCPWKRTPTMWKDIAPSWAGFVIFFRLFSLTVWENQYFFSSVWDCFRPMLMFFPVWNVSSEGSGTFLQPSYLTFLCLLLLNISLALHAVPGCHVTYCRLLSTIFSFP